MYLYTSDEVLCEFFKFGQCHVLRELIDVDSKLSHGQTLMESSQRRQHLFSCELAEENT